MKFEQIEEILLSWCRTGSLSIADAGQLRQAWETCRHGNVLIDTIRSVDVDTVASILPSIFSADGFLTGHERWHTSRVKNKSITIFRGCSRSEYDQDEIGLSWSLSREVAEFFCGRSGGVVLEAVVDCRASVLAWLDTPEHEIVAFVGKADVINVSESPEHKRPAWFADQGLVQRLRPMHNIEKRFSQ